jgi:hypothetical protein
VPTSRPSPFAFTSLNPRTVTSDETTWIAFSRPVASIVAFWPISVSGFWMRTSSAYVPGQTTTTPPSGAAATASAMCEKPAVPQFLPGFDGEPWVETYSVAAPCSSLPAAASDGAAAPMSASPVTANAEEKSSLSGPLANSHPFPFPVG